MVKFCYTPIRKLDDLSKARPSNSGGLTSATRRRLKLIGDGGEGRSSWTEQRAVSLREILGAMESSSTSQEVARLYEQLRAYIRAGDKAGVDESCRELLRAGRPLFEIVEYRTLVADELKGGESEASPSALYYWAQEWRVRPSLDPGVRVHPDLKPHLNNVPSSRMDENKRAVLSRSDATAQTASRRDWVMEWQARQGFSDNPEAIGPSSERANDLARVHENSASGATPVERRVNPTESTGLHRTSSATFLPLIGLCGGALAVVCVGGLLFAQLGKTKLGSAPDLPPPVLAAKPSETENEADPSSRVRPPPVPSTPAPATAVTEKTPARAESKVAIVEPPSVSSDDPLSDSAAEPKRDAAASVVSPAASDPVERSESPRPDEAPIKITDAPSARAAEAAQTDQQLPPAASLPPRDAPVMDAPIVIKGAAASASPARDRSPPARPILGVVSPDTPARPATAPRANAPSVVTPAPMEFGAIDPANPDKKGAARGIPAVPAVPDSVSAATDAIDRDKPTIDAPSPTNDSAALLTRGDAVFGTGDVVSARLFYERVADAGNPQGAIRLGETFDPAFLAHAGLTGVRGDPAVALKWYKRGRELGASEADILIRGLEAK